MTTIEKRMDGKTAEELREMAAVREERSRESFDRCDTDGFLTQWANDITARQMREQAKIVEAGGVLTFAREVLVTLDGEATDGRLVQTKYGSKWRLDSTDEWIGAKTAAGLAKRGYKVVEEREEAPAKAVVAGSGRGLAGAASCYVAIVRADGKRGDWYAVRED